MTRVKFTKTWIESLPVHEQRIEYLDTDVEHLVLRVGKTTRVWYWCGRLHGRPTRMKIGKWPHINVHHARDEARRITGEAADGKYPVGKVNAARDELTVFELFEWWLRTQAKPHNRHWSTDERRYYRQLSQWGTRRVSQLRTEDIQNHHIHLSETKGQNTANRMIDLISTIYKSAIRYNVIECRDPTTSIRRFPKRSRERFLTPDELPKFFAALDKITPQFKDVVLISLFTGARRSNVLSMQWSHVDLALGLWTIPDTESKNKKPMTLPLSSHVIEILQRRRETITGQWVFPGIGSTGHLVEPKHVMRKIMDESGIKDLHFHDLRRTFGSWQAAQGTSLHIIGKSLGHSSSSATQIYARLQLDPIRESVEQATKNMLDQKKSENS